MKKKKSLCAGIKNTPVPSCDENINIKSRLSELIEMGKRNKYTINNWQQRVVYFPATGETFTLGEIDKMINN